MTPLAIATFVLGLLLTVVGGWDLLANEWLSLSIVLFLVTVLDAQLVTLPAVGRLVELTAAPPIDGAPPGPSPEVERLLRKVRLGGTFSAVLLVIITLLMVWKPGV